jgi:hypothetical protein
VRVVNINTSCKTTSAFIVSLLAYCKIHHTYELIAPHGLLRYINDVTAQVLRTLSCWMALMVNMAPCGH